MSFYVDSSVIIQISISLTCRMSTYFAALSGVPSWLTRNADFALPLLRLWAANRRNSPSPKHIGYIELLFEDFRYRYRVVMDRFGLRWSRRIWSTRKLLWYWSCTEILSEDVIAGSASSYWLWRARGHTKWDQQGVHISQLHWIAFYISLSYVHTLDLVNKDCLSKRLHYDSHC